jgi:hypothetical protein
VKDVKKFVWITDMGQCLPGENLSEVTTRGKWRTLDYKTKGGPCAGRLIYALRETHAEPVRLPLPVTGEFNIYVGLWNSSLTGESMIRLKLAKDASYTVFFDKSDVHCLSDHFFKRVKLRSDDLWIAPVNSPFQRIAALAYIRLEPVSGVNKNSVLKKMPVISTEDGFSDIAVEGLRSEADLRQCFDRYKDTDVKRILYSIGGTDNSTSAMRHCGRIALGAEIHPAAYLTNFVENIKIIDLQKIDTLTLAAKHAKENGLEFHLYQRMQAFSMDPPFDESFRSEFFGTHPEWRCVARDGRKTNQMSYVFPEVRKHVLDVIDETLRASGAQGINLTFVRGGPCTLYEAPALEAFEAATGLNAKKLPEDDERYLKFKAEYIAEFMRETRKLLNRAAGSSVKKLELSAHVYGDRTTNLKNGFDLEDWADKKLVDMIVVWPQATNSQYHYNKGKPGYVSKKDYQFFNAVCREANIPLYLCVMVGLCKNAGELIAMARDAYMNGVDGLVLWDGGTFSAHSELKRVMGFIGDKERILSLNPKKFAKNLSFPLRDLGGFMMDKHWSWMGF